MNVFCCFCRRSKSSSGSPRPAAVRRAENNVSSSSVVAVGRSRHDKERSADSRHLSRHTSASDIVRKSSPLSGDHRSKKASRVVSPPPPRHRSPSASPEWTSSKHKRSKLASSPVVASKSHKHNGQRRRRHSRSKERQVHSAADRHR